MNHIDQLVGEIVEIIFDDTNEPATGKLAAIDGREIHVEQEYEMGGSTHVYTAVFSLTGDDETPAVINVRLAPTQDETLF